MSAYLSNDHHLNCHCYYPGEVNKTSFPEDKINYSIFEKINSLCSDPEELRPSSQLYEAIYSIENDRIEIFGNHFKQSKVNFNPSCFAGRSSLRKTNSLYDNIDKQQLHPFEMRAKRTKSSSCYVNGFATSFSYLLIILSCFICYAEQSYVATFGYGVVCVMSL